MHISNRHRTAALKTAALKTTALKTTALVALATGVLLTAACSDSDTTTGGDGGNGTTTTSGMGGTTAGPGAGGGGEAGTGGAGMCLMFGATCTSGDTCCDAAGETGECFTFGMGARCTIPCPANPDDCPAGQGCNNQNPPKCKTE